MKIPQEKVEKLEAYLAENKLPSDYTDLFDKM